ncbi:uncharacterized protein LOC122536226 isoform X1 [Frieseomelitta varia]|uniref:uncharacterized protein LOC122536226 isoform X1 n=1 Tax=Frieseomelitta varia TaxID=561572 RepID=UPI001CB69616|nr:uncharacterized protein LOC122536226 isoform X1 [Frieseomelitta varia]
MNLRNVLNDALFLLLLNLTSSFLQVITEVDVPELQLLASNLKPEECVKLVSLDSDTRLSEAQIEKLAREQNCFRRLVKWVCHLKTVTRNTYPILNSLLERIGRRDLIACLAELSTKTSKSPKVIREARTDDPDDYEETATTVPTKKEKDSDSGQAQLSDQMIEKISGRTTIKLSLHSAGIVVASIILVTCLCTCLCSYIVRRRLTKIYEKIRGKRKKGFILLFRDSRVNLIDCLSISKFIEDARDVSRSYFVRKPRAKRKRPPSYEMVHTATENATVAAPPPKEEPEEPELPACYRCFKKKRKKSTRRPNR